MVDEAQVWRWLGEIPDPELPTVSIVDLGIVRAVERRDPAWVVTVTPTYSGCPAVEVIARDIVATLGRHGIEAVRLETRLTPPWTTDWLTPRGREALAASGIAPPAASAVCPRCGSSHTARVSEFGSTACKAMYRCLDCLEPFDFFKPH